MDDNLVELKNLLLKPPFAVITSLCNVIDDLTEDSGEGFSPSDLCDTILSLFIQTNLLQPLLHVLFEQEVKETMDESTLFRQNSITSKLLTNYCLKSGIEYLRDVLQPLLKEIPHMKIEDYEMDMSKMDTLTKEKVEENTENLVTYCRNIIDHLKATEDTFPSGLRMVCKELKLTVEDKFPNAKYTVIGGLIFLRFICPAIITPEQFGILPRGKVGKSRRILILSSKLLQNVSNNFVSPSNSASLERMNQFVSEMSPVLESFFDNLADWNGGLENASYNENSVAKHLERIVQYLKAHIHKLGVCLVSGHSISARKQAQDQASEKKGYLYKHGENLVSESWRKRYFVLRGGRLLYFKSIEDSHAAGTIILSEFRLLNINLEDFSFQLEGVHRTYWLRANSTADIRDWTNKIQMFSKCVRVRADTRMTTFRNTLITSGLAPQEVNNTIFRTKCVSKKKTDRHMSTEFQEPGRKTKHQRSNSAKYTRNILEKVQEPHEKAATSFGADYRPAKQKPTTSFMGTFRSREPGPTRRVAPRRDRSVTSFPATEQSISNDAHSKQGNREIKSEDPGDEREIKIQSVWGIKPTVSQGKKISPFGTYRKCTPKDIPTRANRSASICAHRVTMAPSAPTQKQAGRLEYWYESTSKWVSSWFVVYPTAIHQYKSEQDEASGNPPVEKILLLGGKLISKSPSFSLLRGENEFTFRAANSEICSEWIIKLKEKLNTPTAILSSLLLMKKNETDQEWKEVWVELNSNLLSTFRVDRVINVPGVFLKIGNCMVHRPEIPLCLGLQDKSHSFFLRFESEEQIKAWMSAIKKTKVAFWKKEAEEGTQNLVNRKGNDKITFSPPLNLFSDAIETGFLLKHDFKDTNAKATRNRYWFVLRGQVLYYYLTEYCENLISLLEIENAMIRTNENDDTFEFEVVGKRETLILEASDIVELRTWHRALHVARTGRSSTALAEEETVSQRGVLINFGRNEVDYLFILNGAVLSWYPPEDEELKSLIGSIGIENCTFCDFFDPEIPEGEEQAAFQITSPNQRDLLLQAETAADKKLWLNQLKKAKLQYWQSSNLIDTFDNRGFLWKITGKKKIRRWFVLNDTYLVYFKSSKDSVPEGEICLEGASAHPISCKETNFRFEVTSGDRDIVLEASNIHSRDRWLNVIKNSKYKAKKPNVTSDERYLALRKPDHEGYLMKQGVKVKNWKRRWFILQYPCLFYFASSQISPGEHTGVIPLQDARVVVKKQNNSIEEVIQFQIETRFRIYFLRADTEEDLDQWVQIIQRLRQSAPEVAPINPGEDVRKGFLVKRDRSNKVWKKRYFILSGGLLSYYRTEQDKDPMGMIPLEGCSVNIADESLKRKFCFVVSTRYRNYFLEAADQFEMAGWIESIRVHSQPNGNFDSNGEHKNIGLFNQLNFLLAQHDKAREKSEED